MNVFRERRPGSACRRRIRQLDDGLERRAVGLEERNIATIADGRYGFLRADDVLERHDEARRAHGHQDVLIENVGRGWLHEDAAHPRLVRRRVRSKARIADDRIRVVDVLLHPRRDRGEVERRIAEQLRDMRRADGRVERARISRCIGTRVGRRIGMTFDASIEVDLCVDTGL